MAITVTAITLMAITFTAITLVAIAVMAVTVMAVTVMAVAVMAFIRVSPRIIIATAHTARDVTNRDMVVVLGELRLDWGTVG
jgi:hypothetical protein